MQCNSETCELPKATDADGLNSDFLPQLSTLKGLKLIKLNSDGSKEEIESESLWKENSCLIYLVRRPGCILCRVIKPFKLIILFLLTFIFRIRQRN